MWITNGFRSLEQVKGIVKLIPNEDVLYSFMNMNEQRIIPLFIPPSKVLRYVEGNYCSCCDYKFRICPQTRDDESDYHYCVNCGLELACCDDEDCDKDRQRAEESAFGTIKEFYKKQNKELRL